MSTGLGPGMPEETDVQKGGRRSPVPTDAPVVDNGARPGGVGWTVAAVLLPALVVALLAGYHLGHQSYWLDEALTVDWIMRSPTEMLAVIFDREANMAGYYLPLSAWVALGSGAETWVRLPSLIAAAAASSLVVLLGRRLFDLRIGFIAGILLACNPMMLEHARDARSYAFVALVAIAAALALARAMDRPTTARWLAYGVVAGVGLWLHFLFALLLVAHGLTVMLRGRSGLVRSAWPALVPLVAIGAPVLAFGAAGASNQVDWIEPLSAAKATRELAALAGGPALAVAGMLAILVVLRRWREPSVRLTLLWLVVPVVLLCALSVVKPLLMARYLIVVVPALCLLFAVAAVALGHRRPVVTVGLTAVLVLASVPGVLDVHTERRDDWRHASGWMRDKAQPGDQLVVIGQRRLRSQTLLDGYWKRAGGPPLVLVDREDPASLAPVRTWVVLNHAPWAWTKPVIERLEATGSLRRSGQFPGIDVFLYEPDPIAP